MLGQNIERSNKNHKIIPLQAQVCINQAFYPSVCLMHIERGPWCKVDTNPDVAWSREEKKRKIDTNEKLQAQVGAGSNVEGRGNRG